MPLFVEPIAVKIWEREGLGFSPSDWLLDFDLVE